MGRFLKERGGKTRRLSCSAGLLSGYPRSLPKCKENATVERQNKLITLAFCRGIYLWQTLRLDWHGALVFLGR